MAQLTFRQAVAAALAQEMERDERVVLLGEDIGSGGVFKTTGGLLERFGPNRVWDTPISEQAIAGAAMGAALFRLPPSPLPPRNRAMIKSGFTKSTAVECILAEFTQPERSRQAQLSIKLAGNASPN